MISVGNSPFTKTYGFASIGKSDTFSRDSSVVKSWTPNSQGIDYMLI